MTKQCIGIVGGGLAGLSLAALLGAAGFDVTCIDQTPARATKREGFDTRTTALSVGSIKVMERAGIWDKLAQDGAAITHINIVDGGSKDTLSFEAHEVDEDAFGWVVDNADLRAVLTARVAEMPGVRHLTGKQVTHFDLDTRRAYIELDDGQSFAFDLLIGADGRASATRDAMHIGTWRRDYKQSALVCLIAHEHPHNGLAIEHFKPSGPFALLPYTDAPDGTPRSALVWSVRHAEAVRLAALDEGAFNAALNEATNHPFGTLRCVSKRGVWPLNLVKAYSYIGMRSVLVAEAAHGMHPIAGQGLNMSLRDVNTLAEMLIEAKERGDDIGNEDMLQAYQSARRKDNVSMCLATDKLTLLFSNNFLPLKIARRWGLRGVGLLPPIKRFFMRRAMGV